MLQETIGSMILYAAGDYRIYDTGQNNGIIFRDGTGGIEFQYNEATVFEIDNSGGVDVLSGGIHVTGDSSFSNNVGIGTTSPNDILEIAGANGKGITITGDAGTTSPFLTLNNPDNTYASVITPRDGDAFTFEYPDGTKLMTIEEDGNVVVGGGSGKITVGTIDPLYDIDGEKYATYMADMIGVKGEVTGTIALSSNYTIDFTKLKKGSDLWLFYQTTDFGEKWENLYVILTPAFDGRVWYTKDPKSKTLTIHGTQDGEVSYRLTANRHDWEKWENLVDINETDGVTGMKIELKK